MKALVLSYYFPPYGGGPTVRVHNFVKHLPRNGVEVAVLTADPQLYEQTYADSDLLTEYDANIPIYRTSAYLARFLRKQRQLGISLGGQTISRWSMNHWKRQAKRLLIPDEFIFWVAKSTNRATEFVRSQKINVILATAPPFSAFLLAALAARRTKIPLVLDYRDLWTPNAFYRSGWASLAMERFIVNQAVRIIVTNEPARSAMIDHFALPSEKVVVIPNGFEGEIIEQIAASPSSPSDTFRMNYIGSLTARRTPEFLFAAIRRLLASRPHLKLQLQILGFSAPSHKELADKMGLSELVRFTPAVPRQRALEIMSNESDLLVLLQRSSEGGDFAIPGKLYEYLGMGIPFIAMDEKDGATARFLEQIGAPRALGYEDVEGIAKRLTVIVDTYSDCRREFGLLRTKASMFDRRKQVEKLAAVLLDASR